MHEPIMLHVETGQVEKEARVAAAPLCDAGCCVIGLERANPPA